MVTAKEFTAKRLREFGESLLNEYEIVLAGQLRRVREDMEEFLAERPPEASVVRETSKNSNRVVVRGAGKASTISGLVPKPPGTDSVNPITTPAEGSPWEGDLWKVQEDETNEDESTGPASEASDNDFGKGFAPSPQTSLLFPESPKRDGFAPLIPHGISETSVSGMSISVNIPDPRGIELHSVWTNDDFSRQVSKASGGGLGQDFIGRLSQKSSIRSGQMVLEKGLLQKAVMRPSSMRCLLWDTICTITIVHDALMIPVLSAFPVDRAGIPETLELISSGVWLVDLFVSFFRGYLDVRTGFVEMRFRRIARNYVTHWFMADLSMIVLDAASLFFMEDDTVDALTLLRLLRNLRLLRLLKMSDRFTILRELFFTLEFEMEWTSVYFATFAGVLQHLGVIALLCHFVGCAWYALGGITSAEITWVKAHAAFRGEEFSNSAGWFYFYMTSVQWALTQFTPAAMDVSAVNTPERIFSVVVCLAGLIAFSFFLGTINQSFSKLRSLTAQETRQNQLVRRYVGDKRVSADLSREVLACIRQRGLGKATGKVVFSDIKVLQSLPANLLCRLQEEVGFPVLEQHGVFKYLTYLSLADVARMCHKALRESSIIYGEDLFQSGMPGTAMYLIQSGRMHYSWDQAPQVYESVLPEQRACEASLWISWEHRGRMTCADQSAHFFQVDASALHKIMGRSEQRDLLAMYAKTFVKTLLEQYGTIDEASDLYGDDEVVAKILTPIRSWQAGIMSFMPGANGTVQLRACFLAWKTFVRDGSGREGHAQWFGRLANKLGELGGRQSS